MQSAHFVDEQPASKLAVSSLVVAWLGLIAFLDRPLVAISLLAIVLSLLARWSTRRFALAGRHLANFSLILSCAVVSTTLAGWYIDYRSESLPGALRLNFQDLVEQKLDLTEFEGREVTLKGYATPQPQELVSELEVTSDGDLKLKWRSILVELPAGQTWSYDSFPVAVTGRLELIRDTDRRDQSVDIIGHPKYVLRDAIIRRARTFVDLAPHAPWNGC